MPAQEVVLGNGHASSPPTKQHAVIVPWPGQGHINPLLHLSRTLATQHGFAITFVNLDYTHRLLLKSLTKEVTVDQSKLEEDAKLQLHNINFLSVPDGIPAEASCTSNVPELCAGVFYSAPAFERLLTELRPPPTCIISDIFVLHTQDAANKLGIPRVAFWTQSAASFAAHVAAARGLFPPGCEQEQTLIESIAGAPPLRFKDLPGFLQPFKEPDFMFDFCTLPFTRLEEAHCVLMNSFQAMEGEALDSLRQQAPGCKFYTIGPVLPFDYFSGRILDQRQDGSNKTPGFWTEDHACLHWLDAQNKDSVLYVSFGSIAELTEEELHEFAWGLEATGLAVLWVLRPGVVGGGHTSLPLGFQERTQGRIHIIDWAPQLHVLAHPSVRAFFTHAGWNSTLEGVSQGKPMLGFPYFADQMLNCRCIEDFWGNGLALERHGEGLLTRSLVESKVRTLVTDAKLCQTALLLRDDARRAILNKEEGSSTFDLIKFVESLSLNNLV